MLTNQIIFDTIVEHFKTQKVRAVQSETEEGEPSLCQYRVPDGRMCAVGVLFLPGEYSPKMDSDEYGGGVDALIENRLLPARLIPFKYILESLQHIHDIVAKNEKDELVSTAVAIALKKTAHAYKLDDSKVDW